MTNVVDRLNLRLHHLRALLIAFCTDREVLEVFTEPEEMVSVLVVSRDTVLYGMCRLQGKRSILHVSDGVGISVEYEWFEGTFLEHRFLTSEDSEAECVLEGDPSDAIASFACGDIAVHENGDATNDWLVISDSVEILEYLETFGTPIMNLETMKGQRCEVRQMRRGNTVTIGLVGDISSRTTEQQIPFRRDLQVCARMLRAWTNDCIVHLPTVENQFFDS